MSAHISYLSSPWIISLITFLITIFLIKAVSFFFKKIDDSNSKLYKNFYKIFRISPHKKLTQFFILKFVLLLLIIGNCFRILTHQLGTTEQQAQIKDFIYNGFYIFQLQIKPGYLLRAAAVFCVILILGQFFEALLFSRLLKHRDKQSATSISALIKYSCFVIGLLVAFHISGISTQTLSIGLGALFVGIGFGLKNLANDFICGLIILINKPIRIGDHIQIEGVEGYVKKIQSISTQIITLTESVMFIPNSSLINKSIINYTYKTKIARVSTQISLEKESDIEYTKTLMLEISSKNPHVVTSVPHQPVVLCEISLSNFVLDLSYTIKNVNMKAEITSEINYAILDALEKKGILLKAIKKS